MSLESSTTPREVKTFLTAPQLCPMLPQSPTYVPTAAMCSCAQSIPGMMRLQWESCPGKPLSPNSPYFASSFCIICFIPCIIWWNWRGLNKTRKISGCQACKVVQSVLQTYAKGLCSKLTSTEWYAAFKSILVFWYKRVCCVLNRLEESFFTNVSKRVQWTMFWLGSIMNEPDSPLDLSMAPIALTNVRFLLCDSIAAFSKFFTYLSFHHRLGRGIYCWLIIVCIYCWSIRLSYDC